MPDCSTARWSKPRELHWRQRASRFPRKRAPPERPGRHGKNQVQESRSRMDAESEARPCEPASARSRHLEHQQRRYRQLAPKRQGAQAQPRQDVRHQFLQHAESSCRAARPRRPARTARVEHAPARAGRGEVQRLTHRLQQRQEAEDGDRPENATGTLPGALSTCTYLHGVTSAQARTQRGRRSVRSAARIARPLSSCGSAASCPRGCSGDGPRHHARTHGPPGDPGRHCVSSAPRAAHRGFETRAARGSRCHRPRELPA